MSTQIQLSQEEIVFIEAKRVADAAAKKAEAALKVAEAAREEAERAEQKEKELNIRKAELIQLRDMAKALEDDDTNNQVDFKWRKDKDTGIPICTMTYAIGDRVATIDLEMYRKPAGSYTRRRGTFAGYKYVISDYYDQGFKNRKYKNTKTLLKTLADFQESARANQDRKRQLTDLGAATVLMLERTYPKAKVSLHGPSEYDSECSKYSQTYRVKSKKGMVIFCSTMKDGLIALSTFRVVPSDELLEEMKESILKG